MLFLDKRLFLLIGANLASLVKKWRITFKKRCDFPNPHQAAREVGGKGTHKLSQVLSKCGCVRKSLFSGNLWKKDLQSTSAAIGTSALSVPTNLPSGIFISLLFQFLSKEITLIRIFAFTEKCHCLLGERIAFRMWGNQSIQFSKSHFISPVQ